MIYTLGYQGGDVDRAEKLVHSGAAILVDVRFSPYSPIPELLRRRVRQAPEEGVHPHSRAGERQLQGRRADQAPG